MVPGSARGGVVLAGGEGRRWGGDKGSAVFRGEPMVLWVCRALAEATGGGEVAVSVSHRQEGIGLYRTLGYRLVPDSGGRSGPLAGLLSAAGALDAILIAAAPCDSPLIRPELYRLLFEVAGNRGAAGAVPEVGGHIEPLHAVYRREAVLSAAVPADAGPAALARLLQVAIVKEEDVRKADPELLSFINLNSPEGMADLRHI